MYIQPKKTNYVKRLLHTTIRTDVKTMEHGFSQHPSQSIGRPLKCVTVYFNALFPRSLLTELKWTRFFISV